MSLIDQILSIAPLATCASVVVTAARWRFTAVQTRRESLRRNWSEFRTSPLFATIQVALAADSAALVFNRQERTETLQLLARLEDVAKTTSASPRDWRLILPGQDYETVSHLLYHCQLLIDFVRNTNVPVNVQCWNEPRRRAFNNLLRAVTPRLTPPS
jgi:hypothetical protein